jgi:hypothetical protein
MSEKNKKMQPNKKGATSVACSNNKPATDFNEVLDRLKQFFNVKSDTALARALGLRQSSVSTAKSKKQIPPAWLLKVSLEYGVSLDWLVYGTGQMKLDEGAKEEKKVGVINEKQVECKASKTADPLDKAISQAAQELGVKLDNDAKLIAKMLLKRGLSGIARNVLSFIYEIENIDKEREVKGDK